MFECGKHLAGVAAGADRKARRDDRVFDLEFTDQRQANGIFAPEMVELELLCEAVDRGGDHAYPLARAIAFLPDSDEAQRSLLRGIDHGLDRKSTRLNSSHA